MKKTLHLLFALLASFTLRAQVKDQVVTPPIPASGANRNNQALHYANAAFDLNLRVPRAINWTLNGAKDSIGYVMYNITLGRFGMYFGNGNWRTLTFTGDKISGLDNDAGFLTANSTAFDGRYKPINYTPDLTGYLTASIYTQPHTWFYPQNFNTTITGLKDINLVGTGGHFLNFTRKDGTLVQGLGLDSLDNFNIGYGGKRLFFLSSMVKWAVMDSLGRVGIGGNFGNGMPVSEKLHVLGNIRLDGSYLQFPDGTRQTTAATNADFSPYAFKTGSNATGSWPINSATSTDFTNSPAKTIAGTDINRWNGKQDQLSYIPVQSGTGVGQLNNIIKIGWNGAVLKATVDNTDLGSFAWRGDDLTLFNNANANFISGVADENSSGGTFVKRTSGGIIKGAYFTTTQGIELVSTINSFMATVSEDGYLRRVPAVLDYFSNSTTKYVNAQQAADAARVQTVAGKTGNVTLAEADITSLPTDLAGKEPAFAAGTAAQYRRADKTNQLLNTDVVPEATTNQYFTTARARNSISSTGTGGNYNPTNGVINFSSYTPLVNTSTVYALKPVVTVAAGQTVITVPHNLPNISTFSIVVFTAGHNNAASNFQGATIDGTNIYLWYNSPGTVAFTNAEINLFIYPIAP